MKGISIYLGSIDLSFLVDRITISRSIIGQTQKTNPSCPPFYTKGRNAPLWKRGIRGGLQALCPINYGLLSIIAIEVQKT
jgi:hypothetical protein